MQAATCALAALALALPSAHAAGPPPPPPKKNSKNEIKCTAISFGVSTSEAESVFTELGTEYALHLCGDDEKYHESGIGAAETKIARAFAAAVAATYVDCKSIGKNVVGHAEAYAHATASASAWAKALGKGFVSVETCSGCKAAAKLFVKASTDIFAKALAKSESKLVVYGQADGREQFQYAKDVQKDVQETLAQALVAITAEVKVAIEHGEQTCSVKLTGCAEAGAEFGCCEIRAGSEATIIETDALAEASSFAAATRFTCADDDAAEASAETYAEAIAEAWVKTVSRIESNCKTTQNGSACSWAATEISAAAEAEAKAVATAIAEADNACNCKVNVEATAKAFKKIFVDAHTKAALDLCQSGPGLSSVTITAIDESRAIIKAIASAIAEAHADHEGCDASAEACAKVGSNKACCSIDVNTWTESRGEDAYAEANAIAGAFLCGTDTAVVEAESKALVVAVAEAWAAAIVDLDAKCDSQGHASACSIADAEVTAVAEAEAAAMATAWAGTAGGCGCDVEVDATKQALKKLFVTVTNNVWKSTCVKGKDWKHVSKEIVAEITKQEAAIALAFASIKDNGKNCKATAGAGTTIKPDVKDPDTVTETDVPKEDTEVNTKVVCGDCVKTNKKCAGKEGATVKGCCHKHDVCVRRSKRAAICKRIKGKGSKGGKRAVARFTAKGYGQELHCSVEGKH